MPKPDNRQKMDNPEQSKAFVEKAKEIGAGETESPADKLLGRLAKKPPEPRRQSSR